MMKETDPKYRQQCEEIVEEYKKGRQNFISRYGLLLGSTLALVIIMLLAAVTVAYYSVSFEMIFLVLFLSSIPIIVCAASEALEELAKNLHNSV